MRGREGEVRGAVGRTSLTPVHPLSNDDLFKSE